MTHSILFSFIEAWLIGLIALVLGRFAGRTSVAWPAEVTGKAILYLQVWAVTFLAQLAFGSLGHMLTLKEHVQSGFAEFLLPIAAGAFFTRQMLIRRR